MCLICPNHECAHFWPFLSNFPLLLPAVHYVLTLVHAGRMDQWTIYDMGVPVIEIPVIETGTLKIYTKMVLYMKNEFLTSNTPSWGLNPHSTNLRVAFYL